MLGLLGAGTAGAVVGAAGGAAAVGVAVSNAAGTSAGAGGGASAYAYFGPHQAGIVTPAQDRLHFAAFDVTTTRREELVDLLAVWTAAAVAPR